MYSNFSIEVSATAVPVSMQQTKKDEGSLEAF